MKILNIKDFKNGWLFGNFEPSLEKNQAFDIGVLEIKKGTMGDFHYHKQHIEYNIILSGQIMIPNYGVIHGGDIFIIAPLEKSNLEFLEDTRLLVVKSPATNQDKFY